MMEPVDFMEDIAVELSPFPRSTIFVEGDNVGAVLYGLSKDDKQVRVIFTCQPEYYAAFCAGALSKLQSMRKYTLDELVVERARVAQHIRESGGIDKAKFPNDACYMCGKSRNEHVLQDGVGLKCPV